MKHERIETNPKIMFGKPVIKGTRITVEHILRKLSAGLSVQQILEGHPRLIPDDVYAAAAHGHRAKENADALVVTKSR